MADRHRRTRHRHRRRRGPRLLPAHLAARRHPSAPADHVTGTDYGRFDSDGNLCLEGRVDGAEKLAGVLVRPREIERHILALDGVSDVRVTVETAPNGLEHLAATVVGAVGPDTVRAHCADLPEQHRPSRIRCTSEQEAASVYSSHGKL
ncbi:hypothetical protein GCM10020256_30320 [Streptomyces thermocoprophilus]